MILMEQDLKEMHGGIIQEILTPTQKLKDLDLEFKNFTKTKLVNLRSKTLIKCLGNLVEIRIHKIRNTSIK